MQPAGPDIDETELALLASEASLRVLAEQGEALRDLRTRASTLLAATSLTVSFLGGPAIEGSGLDIVAWLAIGAFVVSLFAALYTLMPRHDVVLALDGPQVYGRLWDARGDVAELHSLLAQWTAEVRSANRRAVKRQVAGYEIASIALVVQILLWIVQLGLIL